MNNSGGLGDMELQEKAAYCNSEGGTKTRDFHGTSEKAILLERSRRVTAKTAVKLRLAAIVVSWLSTIISLVLGVTAIVFAWTNDSQSLFGFGIDALLDCISSIIILWRFHRGDTIYSDEKEARACIAIGVLFNVSAAVLLGKAIAALIQREFTDRPQIVLILAACNCAICLLLGVSKVLIGYRLESRALLTDSITTLVGALMSLFTLVFSILYQRNTQLWFLDDAFGIACAVFLVCYGIRVIVISLADIRKMKQAG